MRSLSNRISEALRRSGVKRPGEATHFGRKIMVTLLAPKLSKDQLEVYLGHSNVYSEATKAYLLPMFGSIPPEHRSLVDYLPSPEELRAELAAFEPVERPDIARRQKRVAAARKAVGTEDNRAPEPTSGLNSARDIA